MIVNEASIKKKYEYLDKIEEYQDLLYRILDKNINEKYNIEKVSRIWDGGGSTLYKITTDNYQYFLKVKSSSMTIESKLEEERDFIDESCLEYEKNMLVSASKMGMNVPNVCFFEKCEGFDFLALEYIEHSLVSILENLTIEDIIDIWDSLVKNVKILYNNGIVHSDLHENNIRYGKGKIYIIDFEEAKYLKQDVPFENSLDYIGFNEISTLGKFPYYMQQNYTIPYNCLKRLKEVFNSYLSKKVFEYVKLCNYDSCNGICTSLDHGTSNKTYQTIQNKYFLVSGQRSQDNRIKIIENVCQLLLNEEFTFIDVGSNNGLFCREMCLNVNKAKRCIGLEGFHNFNVLAKGLAFIEDIERIEYVDFICGKDSLSSLNINGNVVFSICSVWHHIGNKEGFLNEIKKLDVQMIIFEFAVQDNLYDGASWEVEGERIMKELGFSGKYLLTKSLDYDRPLVLLTRDRVESSIIKHIQNEALKCNELCFSLVEESQEEHIKKYLNRNIEDNNYIICFGTGAYGKKAASFFGDNIAFYIDNDESKKEFLNYKVYTPKEASKIIGDDTKVVISTSEKYQSEIKSQLEGLNIKIKNLITLDELLENGYWYGKYASIY